MIAAIFLIVCAFATTNAQVVNPNWGMGTGTWGNHMLNPMNPLNPLWRTQTHSGPGVLQTSQVNSMTYPVWKSHPLYRMSYVPSEKAAEGTGTGGGQGILNIPKVPGAQEVLTHMALATQNVKPYFDTIADFLYSPEQLKGRQAVVTGPVYVPAMNGMNGMTGMTGVNGMSGMTGVNGMTGMTGVNEMNGMGMMRANIYNPDDCPQESRYLRDLSEWVF